LAERLRQQLEDLCGNILEKDPVQMTREEFHDCHAKSMQRIKEICMEVVPCKGKPKAIATFRIGDAKFRKLWRARKEAFAFYRGMVRPTMRARQQRAEAFKAFKERDKELTREMGAARNRFYTKLANEVKEAWMEHKTADMYRALKKLTEPKRPETYENDMEQGAILKLDGTLTRTPRETQARWTEYFRGLLNQESELLRCQDPSWVSIYSTASLKVCDRPGEEGNTDRFFQGWVPLSMVARDDIGIYDYCSECKYAGNNLPSIGRGSAHYLWERELWTGECDVEEHRVEGDVQGGNLGANGSTVGMAVCLLR
jgi:hypothetical protein